MDLTTGDNGRTNALTSCILVERGRAIGIEYIVDGERGLYAEGEVILSGGACNSPQHFMLSGIGHPDERGGAGAGAAPAPTTI